MKQVSGKQLARVLEQHGWQLKRIHGSHHIFSKPGRIERISIPAHGNQPLKIGLLRHLMRLAELHEKDL